MEQDENDESMRFLRNGISNFLAGIYLIVTVLQLSSSDLDVELVKCMSWFIGGAFVIAGFSITLVVFPVRKAYKEWIEKWEPRLLPGLYTSSIVQLIINVACFYASNSLLLLSITGVFLIVVLSALGHMIKKKNVLNYLPTLMLATLWFNALSIVLLIRGESNWQILPYAGIGIVLLIKTILRYEQIEKRRGKT